jgi:hypothetical protein
LIWSVISFLKRLLVKMANLIKYLTDQRQGLKVMAHFYASFRLHVARGRGALVP